MTELAMVAEFELLFLCLSCKNIIVNLHRLVENKVTPGFGYIIPRFWCIKFILVLINTLISKRMINAIPNLIPGLIPVTKRPKRLLAYSKMATLI